MKKLLYILLIVVSSAAAFTSCTDDEVAPKAGECGRGGGVVVE